MGDRFRSQQFKMRKKIIRGFLFNSKELHKFRIADLFSGQLFFLPALYLQEVIDPALSGDAFQKGNPVSGGKALVYYGQASSLNSEELLTAGLPLLLFTGMVTLGAYRVIRNKWDAKIRNEVQNE